MAAIAKTELPSPAVLVDLDVAERNIQRLAKAAQQAGIQVRPHIKAHKSVYLAKKQLEAGACGVTVAKLGEAEVMCDHGVKDILVAYPLVGEEKLARLRQLHQRARITTTVDSLEVARGLATVGTKEHPLPVLLEIDAGIHRCGRPSAEEALRLAREVSRLEGLAICGLFTYNGQIYQSQSRAEIEASARAEAKLLTDAAALFRSQGFVVSVLSAGSTPATLVLDQMAGVTEIRPGNYVFYDVSALALGVAKEEDCALRVLATVVSVPLPGYATIDAGSKTLTSDLATHRDGYGQVVGMPEVKVAKLNEEHGYLRYDPAQRQFQVGDRVEIIPNHACVVPNLFDSIYGLRGDKLELQIDIQARGKNY